MVADGGMIDCIADMNLVHKLQFGNPRCSEFCLVIEDEAEI